VPVPKEAIVLAGGFGTRLQHILPDIPKALAPIGGKPFLHFILRHLSSQGINRVVLSVGHKWELIQNHFGNESFGMKLDYQIESEPLGTGGAIKASLDHVTSNPCFVVNGDSLFMIHMEKLAIMHQERDADVTIALKHMKHFDRYGTVEIDDQNRITAFREKQFVPEGIINAGTYLVNRDLFRGKHETRFSMEKDFFERELGNQRIFGLVFDDYFIDIGIPTDYERAQLEIG
jgi:D-glycero-alpha-D-manno-heptose 1-phosphate guanylyltransferase